MKKLFSLLMAILMIMSLATTAFAADASLTFTSLDGGLELDAQPGSEYTETDLFDNFKDVMPGDVLTQNITVKNDIDDCDYIKVYMRAIAHDEEGNPLTYSEAFENDDGKDQANVTGQRDETVATMADFLAQLSMRIYNGDELIYEASPDELDGLAENVLLGEFRQGESTTLRVELEVPIDLGNKYANRVGEVDWIFKVEGFDDPTPPPEDENLTVLKVWDDNNYPERPESVTVHLMKDGKIVETVSLTALNQWTKTWGEGELERGHEWTVKEVVPEGYEPTYTEVGNLVIITNHQIPPEPTEPEPTEPQPTEPEPTEPEPTEPQPTEPQPTEPEPTEPQPTEPQPTEPQPTEPQPTEPQPTEPQPTEPQPTEPQPTEPQPTEPEPTEPQPTEPQPTEPEPTEPEPTEPAEPVDLTVKKTWKGDKDTIDDRPESVRVTLFDGEKAVETVVLGDWNNWTYTWKDLDGNGDWSVLEVNIPKGYTPSYKVSGDVVTITNTATLIQTGQLNWPIPVLGSLGVLMIFFGIMTMRKKKKNGNA